MNLEEIFNEWEADSEIKPNDLDREALRIPSLHHKYYKMLSYERVKMRNLETTLAQIKKLKTEYYLGTLDLETMKERGYRPMRLKILKQDIPTYLEADEELIQQNLKIAIYKEKIELLDSIIRTIGNRGFHIKAAIDYMKFKAGEF